ncbi:ankyrin repeat-containing domain protein [Desarmillaria tabescens]|uniref:Ankyrin repeat-containing domain protein n=1 Tax=Armillaria tabescens TaxID=1929756 RepID=A0AA39MYU4_ARMTA|nr:ankyrin repeat-containing domain protein [Desarmillaria tabescens]KAK0451233.1 ankyrin repeat-containing domain protein [Desarmillaria tabescens]
MEDDIITFLGVEHHRRVAGRFTKIYGGTRPFAPSPILFAAYYGLAQVMKVLLNQGADLRKDLPLGVAAQEGHLEMVKLLLSRDDVDDNQADPERRYRTPPMEAARNGHPEVVRALLECGRMESLNTACENGASALFWAVWGGHSGVVRILLAQPGIKVTTWDESYESPLMVAAGRGHSEIVRMFLEQEDINLDAPSFITPQTALRYAADTGHEQIVKMLLKTGRVDVNGKDRYGFTALAGAAKEGQIQAVKVLLEHPDIDTIAKDGRNAYDLAVENGHHEIVSLLATCGDVNYAK